MNKLLYVFVLLISACISAQNAFTAIEIQVERGQGGAVAKIVDDFMKDAKFKENSGFNLERLWQGSGDFTHRFVFYGPIGDRGRAEGDMSEYENNENRRLPCKRRADQFQPPRQHQGCIGHHHRKRLACLRP